MAKEVESHSDWKYRILRRAITMWQLHSAELHVLAEEIQCKTIPELKVIHDREMAAWQKGR